MMMRKWMLLLLVAIGMNGWAQITTDSLVTEPIVLGYFPSWSESYAGTGENSKLREVPDFVNYVFLSFAKPDLTYEKGSYDLSGTGIETPYDGCTLKESVAILKSRGTHVILSVGGETYWQSNTVYENIDYQQIKDLVDDIGFVGIDWDFEPSGSFQTIGNAANVQNFIDFFNNSRALMPRDSGYVLACAPAGVGAMGGATNDDVTSPFAYGNRNTLTGESDVNLFSATTPTNGISLFGFTSTGHMIPVMEAVGDKIDIIAFQGYNSGASTNRKIMYDAYAHYAEIYGFKVAAGVHYPNEPWGPYYDYTHQNVAELSEHVYSHPDRAGENDGIMIWQLLLAGNQSSGYSYMNVASEVLGGTSVQNAVASATNFTMNPYDGTPIEGATCGDVVVPGNFCGVKEYSAELSYGTAETEVYYSCKIWENQWYANPGESPGQNEVWVEVRGCNDDLENCINSVETINELYLVQTATNLKYSLTDKVDQVRLISVIGNEVYSSNVEGKEGRINLSNFSSGVYLLSFQKNKETVLTKKIVINK